MLLALYLSKVDETLTTSLTNCTLSFADIIILIERKKSTQEALSREEFLWHIDIASRLVGHSICGSNIKIVQSITL